MVILWSVIVVTIVVAIVVIVVINIVLMVMRVASQSGPATIGGKAALWARGWWW